MKTANLRAGSQAARRRRTIGGSAGIEITLPKLKDETNFMSNPSRIVSRSSAARVLPDAHLEVDFFQAAEHGLASGGDCRNQGGFAPPIHIHARQFALISFMPVVRAF